MNKTKTDQTPSIEDWFASDRLAAFREIARSATKSPLAETDILARLELAASLTAARQRKSPDASTELAAQAILDQIEQLAKLAD